MSFNLQLSLLNKLKSNQKLVYFKNDAACAVFSVSPRTLNQADICQPRTLEGKRISNSYLIKKMKPILSFPFYKYLRNVLVQRCNTICHLDICNTVCSYIYTKIRLLGLTAFVTQAF